MLHLREKVGKHLLWMFTLVLIPCSVAYAATPGNNKQLSVVSFLKSGDTLLQLGGFQGIQGRSQHIDIPTLIGDDLSVDDRRDYNVLLGMGYYLRAKNQSAYQVNYGLNVFYLPELKVKGDVAIENTFRNLSYQYKVSHLPVYMVIKGLFHTASPRYDVALDAGLGPNFMFLRDFKEAALTPQAVPDDPFINTNDIKLSATLGVSVRINNVAKSHSIECGYRFFYLGNGAFDHTSQVSSSLDTGNTYANALLCSFTL